MSDEIKVSKIDGDQYLITQGMCSRRYRNTEQIFNELYNDAGTDVSDLIEKLDNIEKRLERIECFCNSLADAIAPLEAFR